MEFISVVGVLTALIGWTAVGLSQVQGIALAAIYWNSSNPIFKSSKNSHVIEVNIYDEIDFICPYYPHHRGSNNSSQFEHYIVYQVNKQEYDDCNIYSENTAVMIINCSNPFHRKRFTLLFETFQAIPNVPEFVPGGKYYYISTSTGHLEGLINPYLGACSSHNMKLVVSVCCESSTTTLRSRTQSIPYQRTVAPKTLKPGKSHQTKSFTTSNSHLKPADATVSPDTSTKKTVNNNLNEVLPKHEGLSSDSVNRCSDSRYFILTFLSTVSILVR